MPNNSSLSIRPLCPPDAGSIAAFMRSQSPEYLRFFYAFTADEAEIAEILSKCEKDVYSGIFWGMEIIGVFMLRGWDDGYEIPAFGVLIDEKHRGNAFKNLSHNAAKLICKLSGVNRFMVKIHPENSALKNAHLLGYYQTGIEESTGNIIFHLDF